VNGLASLLSKKGDHESLQEAQSLYERSVQGYEESLGESHPDTLGSINDLIKLLTRMGQGDSDKVETLRSKIEKHGKEKIDTAHASNAY
jgi:hypothetical protein